MMQCHWFTRKFGYQHRIRYASSEGYYGTCTDRLYKWALMQNIHFIVMLSLSNFQLQKFSLPPCLEFSLSFSPSTQVFQYSILSRILSKR